MGSLLAKANDRDLDEHEADALFTLLERRLHGDDGSDAAHQVPATRSGARR